MTKAQIRKQIIEQLSKISQPDRKQIEKSMHATLFDSAIWKNARTIGVTIHQEGVEWDTATIIKRAWKEKKTVAVPKCIHTDRSMQFYDFRSFDELEVVYFNLQEPIPRKDRLIDKQAMDVLLVPGVVFDQQGYRIGFGGGYYDRFLVDFNQTTISLASKTQLIEKIPTNAYDIAVQSIITEDGFI